MKARGAGRETGVSREALSKLRHDLKNQITPIKEFASLLLEGVAGDLNKQQREYLEYLKESVEKMTRMVDQL